MEKYLENLQKDMFSSVIEPKQIPSLFAQTVHHHHHPYFSQIHFNNSFINHPIHFSTPKKRRTKVNQCPSSFLLI
jgi:hypothetical protein